MTAPFRCSVASADTGEPLAGSAPADPVWLFVEDSGPWGRKALAESRLPDDVRRRLLDLAGVRVQLLRRYGGGERPGTTVIAATAGPEGFGIEAARLENPRDLLDLDLGGLAHGRGAGLPAHDAPLWLVCTNGRRDVCCAEQGRTVAAALAQRWPEETWETTHLGGHRFAATLLALPSGHTLGRLGAESATDACAAIERGEVPLDHSRGRAGTRPEAQVAELHLRRRLGVAQESAVQVTAVDEGVVTLRGRDGVWRVEVRTVPGPAVRQSCASEELKRSPRVEVVDVAQGPA